VNTPPTKAGGFRLRLNAGLRGGAIPATVEEPSLLLSGEPVIAIGGHAVYSTKAEMKPVRTYMEAVPGGENIKMATIRNGERIEIKAPARKSM
jgi:hypothetical protein